jgi:NADH:ubiquinone oxidoreductase subunit 4 (subunit M)
MTLGIIALAVPGSSNFAGEFMILTGVFKSGWGWSVVGAVAIVLAAMYVLRLISAVLHQSRGSAVSDSARDLRLIELAFLAPLVAILIFFSAWPAAITDHTFGQRSNTPGLTQLAEVPAPITVPESIQLQGILTRYHIQPNQVAINVFRKR